MKKFILGGSLGFVATFITNSIIALFVIGPLFNNDMAIVRTEEQGLNMPAMLIGYIIISFFMVWVFINNKLTYNWVLKGILIGFLTGTTVFFAGHMIIAGWSVINSRALILSGLFDAFSPIAGGLVIGYIYK